MLAFIGVVNAVVLLANFEITSEILTAFLTTTPIRTANFVPAALNPCDCTVWLPIEMELGIESEAEYVPSWRTIAVPMNVPEENK